MMLCWLCCVVLLKYGIAFAWICRLQKPLEILKMVWETFFVQNALKERNAFGLRFC